MAEKTHHPIPLRDMPGPVPAGLLDEQPSVKQKARRVVERASGHAVNVGSVERVASTVAGGALLMFGLARRSPVAVAGALAGGSLLYRGLTGHCHFYGAVGINTAEQRERGWAGPTSEPMRPHASVTIQKPAEELYRAWRDAGVLTRIMGEVAEVTAVGPDLQHWKVRGPLGRGLEWDARLIDERPGEVLRWESVEGADVPNRGSVMFSPAPGNGGTVVTLHFQFDPPGGALGNAAVKLLGGVPSKLAYKKLLRFKSLMETGALPSTGPHPSARAP